MAANFTFFPLEASILSGPAILEELVGVYPQNIRSCRLHYRSIHDTYIVKSDRDVFYFKVYRYGFRSVADIQTEIDWLNHLKACGVRATEPVARRDGAYIIAFDTLQGTRYGVLYRSVGTLSFDDVVETDGLNQKLGAYLAAVHGAWDSAAYAPGRSTLDVESFIEAPMQHIREFAGLYPFDLDFLEQVASKTKQKIAALAQEAPEYGICHGDFYGGNIRFDDADTPVLYDFDFSGYGWRAYDISLYASPMSWGVDAERMLKRERRKAAFLDGYAKIRALSGEEEKTIDLFTPFRRIFNIGTIYVSMANTWGDDWAIRNTHADIRALKKWLDLNPVL